MRNFLTDKEFAAFKFWISTNGFSYEDRRDDNVVFSVTDGQYDFHVTVTSDPELYEVFDESEKQNLKYILEMFYKGKIFLYGIEVPKKKIEKFVPEYLKEYLNHFDHFRIVQRQDKLWDLLGAVGFYTEKLAICDHKLPLKVFGSNFLETYWTLIYTNKRERKELCAKNYKHDGPA